MEKKITVTISSDGKITTVVNGIAGPSCGAATKFLEELGAVVEDRHTDEFYVAEETGTGLEVGGW
ncbi:MAG: DUF2997 domain-containing protein [Anaerolineae bacterium]|nr:DUF2997 domain-containing protein [Anaerolineae bacterium]